MPVIDEDGNIGYYEWESKVDYEWLGIPRNSISPKTEEKVEKKEEEDAP